MTIAHLLYALDAPGARQCHSVHSSQYEIAFKGVGLRTVRVNVRTRAADQLAHYVNNLGLPVLGCLRDTQNYVQLAAHGATVWDVAPSRVEKDLEQWQELLDWLRC